ncbi:SMI1/KNR4 family protein [Methylomonas fluvii]|uniref:SMI1/KNR4 family protein n=1 Tax=Methylomonas fluvii TaxID=1854564 RepID=A0ABR9D7W0_9GAMM|nr:SMI1/KNR4 family protein [Methylomonas fluvii]MBD9359192.1 SMI1/KNR4 family protein [Methylomonas fluvii]
MQDTAIVSKIFFSKGRSNLSPEDIVNIQQYLNPVLPEELVNHYLMHNGGIPSNSFWILEDGCSLWVKKFLPMKFPVGTERTLEDSYLLMVAKNVMPKALIPFAIDHGGNYFCIDTFGEVYFYAVDRWDEALNDEQNHEKAKKKLGVSFQWFVNQLVESDEYED